MQTTAIGELLAKSFYTLMKSENDDNSLYAGISYIPDADWTEYTTTGNDSDVFAGGSNDSDYDIEDATFYNQTMYSMHKIYAGGVSRVVKRIDWEYGSIYKAYPEVANSYVLVKEYIAGYATINVYRCVFSPNSPSYVSPSGTSQSAFLLSDGYVWKYLYSVTNSQAIRFLNDEWMPVPEKIPESEFGDINIDSANYYQYISQITSTSGEVYGANVDSDALMAYIDSDTTFRTAFAFNSIDLVGRDQADNTPTQELQVRLTWDSESSSFKTSLIQKGSGYIGPVTFGTSAISSSVDGITTSVTSGSGFGSDLPKELEANNVMVSARVVPDEEKGTFYANSQYNMITLHSSPIDATTNTTATNEYYVTCQSFTAVGNTFANNEVIRPVVDDGRRFTVVATENNKVYYIVTKPGDSLKSFANGEQVCTEAGTKTTTISATHARSITFGSSKLIIADKLKTPVTRLDGQIEAFNFILSF